MKLLIKKVARVLAYIITFPYYLIYLLYRTAFGKDRAAQWLSQRFAHLPGIIGEYLRRSALSYVLEYIGEDVVISHGTIFSHPEVHIEKGVYIGANCVIGKVHIGENTLIGDGVIIPSGKHQHKFNRVDVPIKDQGGEFKKIIIGKDCWIGSGAIILADVGDHSIIGAGSVVTEKVDNYKIVVGHPAREIKNRNDIINR